MKGFFASSKLVGSDPRKRLVPACGACKLWSRCSSPKLKVRGKGGKRILLVSGLPEPADDRRGEAFRGPVGSFVKRTFLELGIDAFEDCWMTYGAICHDKSGKVKDVIDHCRPNIVNTIESLNPAAVFLLGSHAVESVLGEYWKDSVGAATRWYGTQIPLQKINAWVFPIVSPARVLAARDDRRSKDKNLEPQWNSQIVDALEKFDGERPYKKVPDYESQIEIVTDMREASKIIKHETLKGEYSAFDYETNMLKPQSPESRIKSCSICWDGTRTIAYPWGSKTACSTRNYLRHPIKKIAQNMAFEEKWSKRILNTWVRSMYFDTLLGSHFFNTEKGTKSIKFQAFVLLGVSPYNKHIENFLKPENEKAGSYEKNRIQEIDTHDLLLYNGMDSLLEYLVAMIHLKRLKAL